MIAVSFRLALVTAVLIVASVFVRRHGAGAERRKQLAWLGYVGLLTAVWAAALITASALTHGASTGSDFVFWNLMVLTPVAGIPLSCVVAVLKYRLYEIDRIISRTLAYAIVTGLLVGLYAGLVLLATRALPVHYPGRGGRATLVAARCSTRCGGGCSGQWTGGSTGPTTTPTRPSPRSRPGYKTRWTWMRSKMTWPVWCMRHWSRLTYRCGSATTTPGRITKCGCSTSEAPPLTA